MLERIQRIHFVGIGGAGLSAIARVLIDQGKIVSGSDLILGPITDALSALGARVIQGHRPANVAGAELIVVSSAVPADNPEIVAATEQGIPVVKRHVLLGAMMQSRVGIAVAGSAGKTTTTAMVAFCLHSLGLDPTFVVGGTMVNLGTNAGAGKGKYFVVEADEYDRMFLGLRPRYAIVTSVEYDHPDCFADEADVFAAFREFVALPSLGEGSVILCGDTAAARLLQGSGRGGATYGFGEQNDYRIVDPQSSPSGAEFVVARERRSLAVVRLAVPGRHNVLNACAALALCDRLGLDSQAVAQALSNYRGTLRRFEVKGEAGGVTIIDDYAHHPTKILATLATAREQYNGRKIWAVFQPHTYSRTRALLEDFARSFGDADEVIVTEVYPARETNPIGTSGAQIVSRMEHPRKHFIATLDEAARFLRDHLRPGDVLLTLGAGDVNLIGNWFLAPAVTQH